MSHVLKMIRTFFRFAVPMVAIFVLMPTVSHAAEFGAGKEYTLLRQETIAENLYVVSGRTTVAGTVRGDLVAAGGSVTVTGDVSDDMLIAGGSLDLLGSVGGDIRIAGGQVILGGTVSGEVVAAGGDIHILSDAVIEGDVHVTGGQVVIDGSIDGNVRVKGGRLVLNGTVLGSVEASLKDELSIGTSAVVGGSLHYRAPREAEFPAGLSVAGDIVYDGPMKKLDKAAAGGGIVGMAFLQSILGLLSGVIFTLQLLAWLGFALLLVWLWRNWVLNVVQELTGSFWKSLGQGVVVFIAGPLVIALLLISFIGTFVGFAAMAIYVLFLMFARAFAAIVLGAWLGKNIQKRPDWRITVPWTVAGIIGLQLMHLIPVLGWLLSVALTLASLGALFRLGMQKAHR